MGRDINIYEKRSSQWEHEHWGINVSINVGVSINAKGGYCWTVGSH
jgi:hypothetical protein